MKLCTVVGARPNFIKIAPFCAAVAQHNLRASSPNIQNVLVHTGQHYDDQMSRAFFEALAIPQADINLGVGSGSHAEQVGKTMMAFEKTVREIKPDWVVVVGDVNATCACSLVAKKERVKLAHIEAGLRSFDMDMPEEINRLVTDRLADLLFVPDRMATENLVREGVPQDKVRFVGNIMIDTLERNRAKAERLDIENIVVQNRLAGSGAKTGHLKSGTFALVTLHRPSNVDAAETLGGIAKFLVQEVAADMPVLWPIHPRTKKQLESFGLWATVAGCANVFLLHPLGYHELLKANMDARVTLTDSGGLQEECCVLGTPCLTLRQNTERPVTLVEHGGVSLLVGNGVAEIRAGYRKAREWKRTPARPELWDGHTADRIVRHLAEMG